jgi:hypothetical protein
VSGLDAEDLIPANHQVGKDSCEEKALKNLTP